MARERGRESRHMPDDGRTLPGGASGADDPPDADRTEAGDAIRPAPDTPPSPGIPRHIGPFHLKRRIAAGGMGVVYEAVQENPRRSVALKLMKPGLLSHSAGRRFEFEAQLLARLRHPGIAQIYDAGTHTENGVSTPYFAMEYIPGALPITAYAAQKKLDIPARIELFRQACDAVHHGHQKGIIHRDLKPDNLLVDSRGRVKVIDFGVARSTDSDLALTTMQTSVGQLIGTLQYMSPEQIHGDPSDIDTRSDVYSLGVILYELLCGVLPYDVRGASIVEATRVIQEADPARPSTVDRKLRGDLETIVLKALEKDRERRYSSAHALSEDLGRFVAGEPIVARAPSLAYQVKVFARRNKAVFAGVLGVMLSLAAGLAVAIVLYVRAEDARRVAAAERDRAREAEAKAQAINDFLLEDLLGAADPEVAQGRELTVMEVVREAAGKVGDSFAGRPELEVPVRLTLARVFRELADYREAETQTEAAVALAGEKLGPDDPRTFEAQRGHARLLMELGRGEDAVGPLRDVVVRQAHVLGDRDPATLETRNALGAVLMAVRKPEEAESLLARNAIDCLEVLGDDNVSTIDAKLGHADALADLSMKNADDDVLDRAIREYEAVLASSRAAFGDAHPMTLTCLNNFATAANRAGRTELATRMLRQVIDANRAVYGENHPNTLIGIHNLGMLLSRAGRTEEAIETFREGARGWSAREFDPRSLLSAAMLVESLIPRGDTAEAESLLLSQLARADEVLPPDTPALLRIVVDVGWLYRARGDYVRAEPYYRRTMEGRERSLGPEHEFTLRAMSQLGWVVTRVGRPEEGERLCREALRRGREGLREGHPQVATILQYLGAVLLETGRAGEAEPFLRDALAIREGRPQTPDTAECRSLLAGCLLELGRTQDAETLLAQAYPVLCASRAEDYESRVETRQRIEELCRRTGRAASTAEVLARLEQGQG